MYYSLGQVRSLIAVAAKLGVSATSVKTWSRAFSWQKRIDERDAAVAHVVEKKSVHAEVDRRMRNKKIVEAGIIAAARAIADGHVKPTLADLDRMLRLEAFLEGEPDSRQEVVERDLRGKTTAELLEMVRAEWRQLRDLVGEDAVFEADEVGDGDLPEVDRN
jgi:hypothetical protein